MIACSANRACSSSSVMSDWAATNSRTNPSWAARAVPLGAPITAGATLPVCFQRCTSLIAQLWLTANRAAAARRDSPPSTALTILLRRSNERGRAIHAGLLNPSPQLESHFKPAGNPHTDSFFLEFALVTLEVLHRAFVLLRRCAAFERAEVASLAGLGIGLARVEAVLARRQLADHACPYLH